MERTDFSGKMGYRAIKGKNGNWKNPRQPPVDGWIGWGNRVD